MVQANKPPAVSKISGKEDEAKIAVRSFKWKMEDVRDVGTRMRMVPYMVLGSVLGRVPQRRIDCWVPSKCDCHTGMGNWIQNLSIEDKYEITGFEGS